MTEWKNGLFNEKPDPIIKIGNKLFMQTKNVQHTTDENGLNFYKAETREVTESELKLLGEISDLEQKLYVTNVQLLNSI